MCRSISHFSKKRRSNVKSDNVNSQPLICHVIRNVCARVRRTHCSTNHIWKYNEDLKSLRFEDAEKKLAALIEWRLSRHYLITVAVEFNHYARGTSNRNMKFKDEQMSHMHLAVLFCIYSYYCARVTKLEPANSLTFATETELFFAAHFPFCFFFIHFL